MEGMLPGIEVPALDVRTSPLPPPTILPKVMKVGHCWMGMAWLFRSAGQEGDAFVFRDVWIPGPVRMLQRIAKSDAHRMLAANALGGRRSLFACQKSLDSHPTSERPEETGPANLAGWLIEVEQFSAACLEEPQIRRVAAGFFWRARAVCFWVASDPGDPWEAAQGPWKKGRSAAEVDLHLMRDRFEQGGVPGLLGCVRIRKTEARTLEHPLLTASTHFCSIAAPAAGAPEEDHPAPQPSAWGPVIDLTTEEEPEEQPRSSRKKPRVV